MSTNVSSQILAKNTENAILSCYMLLKYLLVQYAIRTKFQCTAIHTNPSMSKHHQDSTFTLPSFEALDPCQYAIHTLLCARYNLLLNAFILLPRARPLCTCSTHHQFKIETLSNHLFFLFISIVPSSAAVRFSLAVLSLVAPHSKLDNQMRQSPRILSCAAIL